MHDKDPGGVPHRGAMPLAIWTEDEGIRPPHFAAAGVRHLQTKHGS
jgi:hypothetical protein